MTQLQMMREALRKIGERDQVFMEMLRGPNPLTPREIRRLIEKNPERYGRYEGFAEQG